MRKYGHILGLILVIILLSGCVQNDPAGSGNSLETVPYTWVCNGFLLQPEDERAVAISSRTPVTVTMTRTQTPISHNGMEITADYSWARYENTLVAVSHNDHCSVEPLKGSDRFLVVSILDAGYPYLIDTNTGAVTDPLAVLDDAVTARLGSVSFSPDAQYAVIQYNSGTACILLACGTGQITELPYEPDLYSISGSFLDATHIILCSAFEVDADNTVQYSLARYDVATGELTELPGQHTAKDRSAQNFLAVCDDAFAYSFEDNCLVLVDLMTWKKTHTQFDENGIEQIFYCPNALAGVLYDGVVYYLDYDGTAYAVCNAAK